MRVSVALILLSCLSRRTDALPHGRATALFVWRFGVSDTNATALRAGVRAKGSESLRVFDARALARALRSPSGERRVRDAAAGCRSRWRRVQPKKKKNPS